MRPNLTLISKSDVALRGWMSSHYTHPKGFVGRQLIYRVEFGGTVYGATVGGSSTRFLPGRSEFFGDWINLNNIVNNTFFHIERQNGTYPFRNFASATVSAWRMSVARDWLLRYGDDVLGFETLVELPRTGAVYLRDGWSNVGTTKGYTCKRVAGKGTDNWTGKRVWDTKNLRPKLVLVRKI